MFFVKYTLLFLAANFKSFTSGLQCYQCGTGYVASALGSGHIPESALKSESCENLEQGGSYWSYHKLDCPSNHICAKIINFGINNTTQRGCALLRISNDYEHEIKCGSMSPTVRGVKGEIENNGGVSCYCDTDLCNSVTSLKLQNFALLITIFIIFVTVHDL